MARMSVKYIKVLDSVFSANKRANNMGLELLAEWLTVEQLQNIEYIYPIPAALGW